MDFFFTGSTLGPSNVDSARQNLASSFVNGFVNAGFGQDKILKEDGNKWLHKNKDHGMYFFLTFSSSSNFNNSRLCERRQCDKDSFHCVLLVL